jgi:hypothetical protein
LQASQYCKRKTEAALHEVSGSRSAQYTIALCAGETFSPADKAANDTRIC